MTYIPRFLYVHSIVDSIYWMFVRYVSFGNFAALNKTQLRGKERGPLSGQKLFTCHSAGVAQLWSSLESSFGELKAQKLRNFRRSPDDFFSRRATRKAPRCPSQPRKSKEGKAEKPGVALSGRRKVGNTALAACCLVPRCVCEMWCQWNPIRKAHSERKLSVNQN